LGQDSSVVFNGQKVDLGMVASTLLNCILDGPGSFGEQTVTSTDVFRAAVRISQVDPADAFDDALDELGERLEGVGLTIYDLVVELEEDADLPFERNLDISVEDSSLTQFVDPLVDRLLDDLTARPNRQIDCIAIATRMFHVRTLGLRHMSVLSGAVKQLQDLDSNFQYAGGLMIFKAEEEPPKQQRTRAKQIRKPGGDDIDWLLPDAVVYKDGASVRLSEVQQAMIDIIRHGGPRGVRGSFIRNALLERGFRANQYAPEFVALQQRGVLDQRVGRDGNTRYTLLSLPASPRSG
jgi:hypothetical protein